MSPPSLPPPVLPPPSPPPPPNGLVYSRFTLSGTISDYTPEIQAAIISRFATLTPGANVTIELAAASILVTVRMEVPAEYSLQALTAMQTSLATPEVANEFLFSSSFGDSVGDSRFVPTVEAILTTPALTTPASYDAEQQAPSALSAPTAGNHTYMLCTAMRTRTP